VTTSSDCETSQGGGYSCVWVDGQCVEKCDVRAVPPNHPADDDEQPDSDLKDVCADKKTTNYECELKSKQETVNTNEVDVLYTMYSCAQRIISTTTCDQLNEYFPCINKGI
jgi:hypothetical protein